MCRFAAWVIRSSRAWQPNMPNTLLSGQPWTMSETIAFEVTHSASPPTLLRR